MRCRCSRSQLPPRPSRRPGSRGFRTAGSRCCRRGAGRRVGRAAGAEIAPAGSDRKIAAVRQGDRAPAGRAPSRDHPPPIHDGSGLVGRGASGLIRPERGPATRTIRVGETPAPGSAAPEAPFVQVSIRRVSVVRRSRGLRPPEEGSGRPAARHVRRPVEATLRSPARTSRAGPGRSTPAAASTIARSCPAQWMRRATCSATWTTGPSAPRTPSSRPGPEGRRNTRARGR
jgi:hypothetical protein